MAAAARLGLAVAYGGAIGSGPFAALARAACAAEGIEVLQPAKPGRDTGFVVSIVDATGERTFLTSRGAEATLTAADLDPVRPAPGDAVYLSGYGLAHPSNAAALLGWLGRLGEEHVVVFDPGPLAGTLPGDVLDPVLARADWVTCNARESVLLTGAADPAGRAAGADRAAAPGRGPGPGGTGWVPAGAAWSRGRARARVRCRGRGHERGRGYAHRGVPGGAGVWCAGGRGGAAGQWGRGVVGDPARACDGAFEGGTGCVSVLTGMRPR